MSAKRLYAVVSIAAALLAGVIAVVWLNHSNPNKPATSTPQNATSAQPSGGASLDYSNKGLTAFPKEILNHTDVTSLNLSNNRLTGALPAEIRHLTNLETLNVSNNRMTGIPAEIGQLKRLKVLNYNDNRITGLPLELGNLTQLQVLDLRMNDVSQHDLNLIRPKLPNTEIKL